MGAIIAIIIQYLPYLVDATKTVPQIITFISELRAIFARTKSWTPEQEAAFDASVESLRSDPAWNIVD
jgi:hypothetical protein